MLVGTLIYGLINSVILALMAIGFNLTFGISGVANFAYGAFYILAAYGTWMMLINMSGLPYPWRSWSRFVWSTWSWAP